MSRAQTLAARKRLAQLEREERLGGPVEDGPAAGVRRYVTVTRGRAARPRVVGQRVAAEEPAALESCANDELHERVGH